MYAMEKGNLSIASFFDTIGKESLPRHVFLSLLEEGSSLLVVLSFLSMCEDGSSLLVTVFFRYAREESRSQRDDDKNRRVSFDSTRGTLPATSKAVSMAFSINRTSSLFIYLFRVAFKSGC